MNPITHRNLAPEQLIQFKEKIHAHNTNSFPAVAIESVVVQTQKTRHELSLIGRHFNYLQKNMDITLKVVCV